MRVIANSRDEVGYRKAPKKRGRICQEESVTAETNDEREGGEGLGKIMGIGGECGGSAGEGGG